MSDNTMQPHEKISAAIQATADAGRVALVPFITAGYPDKERFVETLRKVCELGDTVEIGVPFSDPMADGVTIQRASHEAIQQGVSLRWILGELKAAGELPAPVVLMSYLNPLLAYGYEQLAVDAREAGVCGFIVPDLPYEESEEFRTAMEAQGLALIQLVTPATPEGRLGPVCAASRGFVYAVTITGITGGSTQLPDDVTDYLDRVREHANVPVCAGFGVRTAEQVASLGAHAEGCIVGSALVEELERTGDPVEFLTALRA